MSRVEQAGLGYKEGVCCVVMSVLVLKIAATNSLQIQPHLQQKTSQAKAQPDKTILKKFKAPTYVGDLTSRCHKMREVKRM